MCLHFVRDELFFVECDSSRIILKYRDTKIPPFPPLPFSPLSDLLRRAFDVAAVYPLLHFVERVGEYRVFAVLRPRSRECLQFDVGRISLLLRKVITYHLQLFQREGERAATGAGGVPYPLC